MGYAVLLPVLAVFCLLVFYPTARGLITGFTSSSAFEPEARFVGFKNFEFLLSDPSFLTAAAHSLMLVLSAVAFQYGLGLALALLLNAELPYTGWIKSILLIPWVVPVAATVVMFDWMMYPGYGLLNMILGGLGLSRWARYWFGDLTWAFPMIVLMHVWRNVPFYAITLYAGLKTIPRDLYDAAEVDGANSWQRFAYITFPSLRYPSAILITLHTFWTFNNVDFVYLATGGGPVGRTEVLATYVYRTAWVYHDYGLASAAGALMMLFLLLVSIAYTRLLGREAEA